MLLSIEINNKIYKINAENSLPIAIPLCFNGEQPNAYGVEKATSKACVAGEIVGDTRRGGSVNFEEYNFIPHCNGTHTECVGHITHERILVNDCLRDAFIPSQLITIKPVSASETNETYSIDLKENDKLITRKALENNLQITNSDWLYGLVIRTLPNDERKLSQVYLEKIPPFFSNEAMTFINELGIKHLLVDLPSIDRIFDEGNLSNHRAFWKVNRGSFELSAESSIFKTITELIYVSNEISDGKYLLNLQIAAFEADASPSRPVLFQVF